MEHLLSDASYIKTSLICIAKYIKNKKIDIAKSNEIKNLQSIGEAAWKFVSTLYKARWDLLVTDIHNNTFRQKVLYHCTLKTNPVKSSKSKEKDTNKPASIERLPLPISTKTFKEVNEISKFFKTKKLSQANASLGKLYTQASITDSNTETRKHFPLSKQRISTISKG